MPIISVIVPVYNVEKYLPRCIDSILAQTFTDFELILVDDGSPDRCGEICDEYAEKDSRVRVIHKANGGVSSARNAGLDLCRGEYVTFVDSDDYLGAGWLNSLHQAMTESGADVVSADFTVVADGGEESVTLHQKLQADLHNEKETIDFLLESILGGKLGWEVCTRFFKTEIIQNRHIRFCETCENYAEDLGFTLEYLLYVQRVATCNSAEYYYYQRSGSMMDCSKTKYRLNATNEVPKQFAERAKAIWTVKDRKRLIPVIHYLISASEYVKIARNSEETKGDPWRDAYKQIIDKRWYSQNARAIISSYPLLCRYMSRANAREALLFSSFCLCGTWPLFHALFAVKKRLVRK